MQFERKVNYSDDINVHELLTYSTDEGLEMSHLGAFTQQSMYCGKPIKTLAITNVGTEPEFRRGGYVRKMFNMLFDEAEEKGWLMSMLHPFSFSYYRMFGYEKICDHRILEFPMTALDFVPRCPDFVKYTGQPEVFDDLRKVYAKFASQRNIMFPRTSDEHLQPSPDSRNRYIYIRYNEAGEPTAYIKFDQESTFYVMRADNKALHVREMVFTDRQGLIDILGFIRMFEGQQSNVILHNIAMTPEVDLVLRHYIHTKYTIVSDIMGRVLNVKGMLEANEYPKGHGHFVLRVDDVLPHNAGCYDVEYDGDKKEVRKIADTDNYDIRTDVRPLSQILYGYESFNTYNVKFMEGVDLKTEAPDFFRAFPKRSAGLFEHF